MELKSFKELLLKKAADNETLQNMVSGIDDESIIDFVLESLQKMALPNAMAGRHANAAVTSFAQNLKNKDIEMMRDALGHHIANHKAALKAGNREAADAHLERIIPLMHLASKMSNHSGNKLTIDYPPLEAYETNYTGTDRSDKGDGKLHEGTKGLGRRPKSHIPRTKNPYSVPDYRYLEMPPHPGHEDVHTHKEIMPFKDKGYPFEEIQLGNPIKVRAKEAHLHIPDVEHSGGFSEHPFDHHPINKYITTPQPEMTDKMEQFANEMNNWESHDQNKKWLENISNQVKSDPEGYRSRGKIKPSHHFNEIPLLEQEERVKQGLAHNENRQGAFLPQQQKLSATPTPKPPQPPPIELSQEDFNHLTPQLKAKYGGKYGGNTNTGDSGA